MNDPQTTLKPPNYRDITLPFEGATVMIDKWWLCKNGDPRMAAFYEKFYPQCHRDSFVVKDGNGFPESENLRHVFVRVAYCPRRQE